MAALPARALALLPLLALLLAGCLNAAPASVAPASLAERMLASPPGAGVEPSGRTVTFTLFLHRMAHELYPGANMSMWGFSLSDDPSTATVPGPELRVREGDRVVVRYMSLVGGFSHTLHWHGQHVPWRQDGVPYLTQDPVPAGAEHVYEFVARPSGTYWYHCHVDAQHHIDMGMYGVLVVEPRDPAQDPPFDREHTLVLDEMDRFHLEGGEPAAGNQPQSGDPFDAASYAQRQARDVVGRNQAVQDRVTGTPARPERAWYPVTYPPYFVEANTYLINGQSFPHTEPVFLAEGETLRLRWVNVGDDVHAMHLHGHHMLVTHKDGVLLASPWWADTLLLGPGERYDVYVRGTNPGIWDLHDHVNRAVANDHIHPGGMMTLLVYESHRGQLPPGHDHGSGLDPARHAGAYVGLRGS